MTRTLMEVPGGISGSSSPNAGAANKRIKRPVVRSWQYLRTMEPHLLILISFVKVGAVISDANTCTAAASSFRSNFSFTATNENEIRTGPQRPRDRAAWACGQNYV